MFLQKPTKPEKGNLMAKKRGAGCESIRAFCGASLNYKAVADAVLALGGGDAELNRLRADPELAKQIAVLIVGVARKVADPFYLLLFEDQIKAGHYDLRDIPITADKFPQPSRGTPFSELRTFNFGRDVDLSEIPVLLATKGYELADPIELMNYGANNPEEQRDHPIVALGAVYVAPDTNRFVVEIRRRGKARVISLRGYVSRWSDYYYFLARPLPPATL